jgi:glycosyltransferase involved in cell wall biosynthesis
VRGLRHLPLRVVLAKGALRGPISGASETVVTYATHMRRSGHDVSVFLLYPPERANPYACRLTRAGVPVVSAARVDVEAALLAGASATLRLRRVPAMARSVTGTGRSLLSSAADRYARVSQEHIERSGADLVHVVGQDAGAGVLIGAAGAAGLPALFQELGGATHPSILTTFTSNLPLCSEVAALSPRIAERIGHVLPVTGRISVLPIMTEPPTGDAAGRPDGAPVTFGFAGRLEPPKGARLMVEAFARARTKVPGIRLRVAGTGSEERRVLATAGALGVTDAYEGLGVYSRPTDRTSFMRGLDVFLLPSTTEGTPNCIVEAMAHGVPVIATSVGGIPDVVTPEVGILVPPGDDNALAQAMVSLAADPRRRAEMRLAAVERYERLFSPSSVMPLLVETYRRVAGASAAPAPALQHDWAGCGESR